ncbi:hypothetical protein K0M31_010960 [Melipona bicolor]|uniref:Uncharacterized protein n=1 Tax=Melipona bicolor TaxID=60889 RepID=A0AA40FKM1_9HYME|nr:hypothetical protein K0M31_010960 [Melipona bicolor]
MASTRNAAQVGNNSELSGNESTVYLAKASLVTRSGTPISEALKQSNDEETKQNEITSSMKSMK